MIRLLVVISIFLFLSSGFCSADESSEKSEFRIYYYAQSGLVFDEGHGVKEYNSALSYMRKSIVVTEGWSRFRSLCGKMVATSSCSKFDSDLNKPGADYFCANLPKYIKETMQGLSDADVYALQDLCEARTATPVKQLRIKSVNK